MKEHELYWLRRIKQHPEHNMLESLVRDTEEKYTDKRSQLCEVNKALLDNIGARHGRTPHDFFAFFLCVWKTVLYTYTSNGKFVVACPVDTVAWPQQSSNTFFFPVAIASGSSFNDLVFQTDAELKKAGQYSQYDFTSLCGNLLRNTAYTEQSLYAVACCMDDGPVCPVPYQRFDFCLQVLPGDEHYSLRLWYDQRCEDFLAKQLLENCFHVINTVLEHPHSSMAHISFAAGMEGYKRETLVASPPPAATLVGWFEKKVTAMPVAIALKYNDTVLTYEQLDQQATNVANCLVTEYGIVPGSTVGLMMHRSEKTVVAILGILKAGAAYVPVDIHYPYVRARYITEDAGISVIITDDLPLCGPYADIADLLAWEEAVRPRTGADERPLPPPDPERIAYIIYTSGSTGLPKGVRVMHANVISLLNNREFAGRFGPDDVWTLFHSTSFDFSVWEIFGALLLGGRLVVVPYETSRNMQQYLELLEAERVTILNIVPTVFTLLKTMVQDLAPSRLANLRYVIFGGEALEYGSLKQWATQFPGMVLINMYGITETTVHVTFKEITPADISAGYSNVGKPLSSLYVYIMDGNMRPLPAGVRGELVIGGKGLSAGYLNKPELTTAAFISHPLAKGGHLYKSGDLGRMMPNGDIIYEGRKDTQIKIRGFRIETAEIEKVLVRHPDVTDARVVLRKVNGEPCLVAYFITTGQAGSDIKEWLKQQLPEYMVPAFIQPVLSFPVTMNGKLDLERLPLPMIESGHDPNGEVYTPLQQELLVIWEEVLATGPLDIQQNFFEAGGHSLLANRICIEIQQRMNLKINPSQIFLYPTIKELSAVLPIDKKERRSPSLEKSPLVSDFPASYAQARMWSLQHLYRENHLYNIPVAYEIAGHVDMPRFSKAFDYLVQQHESLRTFFQIKADVLIQVIAASGGNIVCEDFSLDPEAGQHIAQYLEDEVLTGFDLSKPPLYRAKIVKTAPDRFTFLFTVHHIIADGWSIEMLINDLIAFYNTLLEDKVPVIRPFAFQYRDYSWWHNRLVNEKRESYCDFWSRYFAGYTSSILLTPDFPRTQVPAHSGALVELKLDAMLSASLRDLAARCHCSMFILLAAALDVLFFHAAGCRDIAIGYPVSGRNYPDIGPLSGLFVNTLVLRTLISEREQFIQLMERLKNNVLEAAQYQEYPFDLIVEDLSLQRIANRNPLFDVGFTWHAESDRRPAKLAGCMITALRASQDTAKTDLWIHGTDMNGQLYLSMQYNLQLYKSSSIHLLAERFKRLLEQVAKHPFCLVQDFSLSAAAMMDAAPALKIELDL